MKVGKSWLIVLLFLCASTLAHAGEPSSITVDTPAGPVTAKRHERQSYPQEISKASKSDEEFFKESVMSGEKFVSHYLPNVKNPSLEDFDQAFLYWRNDKGTKYDSEKVIEMLGSFLGEKCVSELKMEWIFVTYNNTTTYAVRGRNVETMAFPFDAVSKRIDRNEHRFMSGVFHTIKELIEGGSYKSR